MAKKKKETKMPVPTFKDNKQSPELVEIATKLGLKFTSDMSDTELEALIKIATQKPDPKAKQQMRILRETTKLYYLEVFKSEAVRVIQGKKEDLRSGEDQWETIVAAMPQGSPGIGIKKEKKYKAIRAMWGGTEGQCVQEISLAKKKGRKKKNADSTDATEQNKSDTE